MNGIILEPDFSACTFDFVRVKKINYEKTGSRDTQIKSPAEKYKIRKTPPINQK